ncbi:MAG: chromosome partitioning protein ParA, partial [Pseudomonadota bacterium]|nr:chromosome partitioning protein ParA [Pseudomonadota bacterium]
MTSNGQTELETVRKALPAELATRIISARQREDRWTLVVDGEGLDAPARERMEAKLRSALAPGDADPAPAIAFMG